MFPEKQPLQIQSHKLKWLMTPPYKLISSCSSPVHIGEITSSKSPNSEHLKIGYYLLLALISQAV